MLLTHMCLCHQPV